MSTAPDVKRLATAKARAAMAGVQLHVACDDQRRPTYLCIKWASTATFRDLDAVEDWLDRAEGKASEVR